MRVNQIFRRRPENHRWGLSKVIKCAAVALVMLLQIATVHAQQEVTVTGTVSDEEGLPLPGVSIVVKGTTTGAISDENGNFSIKTEKGVTLSFSFVGYVMQEREVTDNTNLSIVFSADVTQLDEVVVVAYGTQSRRMLTSSVSKVNTKELENMSMTNVFDGLKGKIAGARIYNTSGQPGEAPTIIIRGGSSINRSNAPLVLVDGLERGFNEINPNDIESIQILKDAESTAMYGARASNGIVLITTKKGSASTAPRITFQTDFSMQDIIKYYDMCNAEEYLSVVRPSLLVSSNYAYADTEGWAVSGGNSSSSPFSTRYLQPGETVPAGWKSMIDPIDPTRTLVFQDNDMIKACFRTSLRQNYYLGVDGGDAKLRYAGSVGYTDVDGVAISSGASRFTARGAANLTILKNLRAFSEFNFQRTTSEDYPNQWHAIPRASMVAPTARLYMDDGTPGRGHSASAAPAPFYTYMYQREYNSRHTSVSGGLDWSITDHLIATATGTTYFVSTEFDSFQRASSYNGSRPATSTLDDTRRNQYEGLLKYSNVFGQHRLTGLIGMTYMNTMWKSLSAAAQGASSDKIETLNAAPQKTGASTTKTQEVLASVFGRINYSYKSKYLLSASLRRDGSSRFGTNHKWAYFPGASAGWVISEENFLRGNSTLSFLKMRTSIGQTGNNAAGLYTAQGEYNVGYRYNNEPGIVNTQMPNQDLTWEKTTQVDLGVDAGFMKDRILVTFDLYNKRTDDLIFSKPLPNTSGFSSVQTNIGSVRFYGFDIELTSRNIQKKDFSWETSFAWGFVKNKVVWLPDNGLEKNRVGGYVLDEERFGGIAEGEPLYRFYSYKVDHILDTDEQAANARYDSRANGWDYHTKTFTQGKKVAGDYEWCDRNGDGIISENDVFELGVTVPHSTGGLTNTFRYKGFTLRVYLDWALGHSVMDPDIGSLMSANLIGNLNIPRQALGAWKQPGDAAKTKWARIVIADNQENRNYNRDSNMKTFKGDYLCIRDISLGYDLPQSLTYKLKMHKATVFISGNNLRYFTAVPATCPENGTADASSGNASYPPIRCLTAGLKIEF